MNTTAISDITLSVQRLPILLKARKLARFPNVVDTIISAKMTQF